jgi:DNA-binding NarL/FixJ family response regulator
MNNPITILLVDDHEVVRQGVRGFFDSHDEFEVVGEAENGADAVMLTEELIPDVVLMDLLMSDTDGVEATRQVKNISPRTQIVVLTSYHEDEHIFPALQAGALSYILKDVKMEELAEVVRKAAGGESSLHSRVAPVGRWKY